MSYFKDTEPQKSKLGKHIGTKIRPIVGRDGEWVNADFCYSVRHLFDGWRKFLNLSSSDDSGAVNTVTLELYSLKRYIPAMQTVP